MPYTISASFGPALRNNRASIPIRTSVARTIRPITTIILLDIFLASLLSKPLRTAKPLLPCIAGRLAAEQPMFKLFPPSHVRHTLCAPHHNHLRAPVNRLAVFGTHHRRPAGAVLRIQHLAHAALRYPAAQLADHANDVRVRRLQRLLSRQQHAAQKPEHHRRARNPADRRQQQHQRIRENTAVMQQISRASKPAQKRHHRKPVQRRHLRRMMRSGLHCRALMRSTDMVRSADMVRRAHRMMSEVHPYVPEVQMPKPAQKRHQAQHQPYTKTRQIDRFPSEGNHRFDPPRFACELFTPFPCEPLPCEPLPEPLPEILPRAALFSRTGSGETSSGVLRAEGIDPPSGRKTSSSRSLNDGVSKILSSSSRQLRESSCCAIASSARRSSGSRRKRSAPPISQRSSFSSSVVCARRSLSSSA